MTKNQCLDLLRALPRHELEEIAATIREIRAAEGAADGPTAIHALVEGLGAVTFAPRDGEITMSVGALCWPVTPEEII